LLVVITVQPFWATSNASHLVTLGQFFRPRRVCEYSFFWGGTIFRGTYLPTYYIIGAVIFSCAVNFYAASNSTSRIPGPRAAKLFAAVNYGVSYSKLGFCILMYCDVARPFFGCKKCCLNF